MVVKGFSCACFLLCSVWLSSCSDLQGDWDAPVDESTTVGRLVFNVEHSFGSEDDYKPRGQVTISNLRNRIGTMSPSVPLTSEEQRKLQALAESKGIYRIRVPTPGKIGAYVSTIAPACGLLEAGMKDILVFSLDNSGNLLGISDMVAVGSCTGPYTWMSPQDYVFNTTLEIRMVEPGPVPETAAYIQKLEQERVARERGEGKDNRSFLAKYWIYIVIVMLFMIMSNANQPDQGGGGSGGSDGG